MKYYFITYQGVRRDLDPDIAVWHNVINVSPMEYREKLIKDEEKAHKKGESYYEDFLILNTLEISEQDYYDFKGRF